MSALEPTELYLQHIEVDDDLSHVDYRDTEHYQVMRRFLEDPERMLGYLFD